MANNNTTKKYRGVPKVKVNGGLITIKEASERMKISSPACQAMYNKGIDSLSAMEQYRVDLAEGKMQCGGTPSLYHETSMGRLTLEECAAIHPHGLVQVSIRYRGDTWGYDHKCLWLPKGRGFKAKALALDGPPRPANKKTSKLSKCKVIPLNRRKACYRDQCQIRCVHYGARMKMFKGVPEVCSVASGDSCSNFKGQRLPVYTNSSGRSVKRYAANGTSSEFR